MMKKKLIAALLTATVAVGAMPSAGALSYVQQPVYRCTDECLVLQFGQVSL